MPIEVIPLRIGHCRAPEKLSRRDRGWRMVDFPAGAVLLRHHVAGDILFDCGYGPAFFAATRGLPERFYRWTTPVTLTAAQTLPTQLLRHQARPRLVILSHLHADHSAGLFDLDPLPPVLGAQQAWDQLSRDGRIATLRAGCPQELRDRLLQIHPRHIENLALIETHLPPDLGPAFDTLGDGSMLAIPLPGHGIGQFGLYLQQTHLGRPVFLIGDAAWSRAALHDNAPPPDFTLRKLGDRDAYLSTFAHLRALMLARPDILFFPSHCPEAFGGEAV